VCRAPETEDVFLGFASGEVVCYRPSSGEAIPLPFGPSSAALTIFDKKASGTSLFQGDPVTCLATGPKNKLVVALSEKDDEPPSRTAKLISFSRRQDGSYTLRQSRLVPVWRVLRSMVACVGPDFLCPPMAATS
jgi:hypothetical protein